MTTRLTSEAEAEAEASESENYGRARPKITSRTTLTSASPSVLPQEAVARNHSSHTKSRQEQQLEDHVALLRDEIFNVIPGTMNMQHGTASKNRKNKSGGDEVFHLPQVPDMPIAHSGHGHEVTFRSPVVRPGSISSTPHVVP